MSGRPSKIEISAAPQRRSGRVFARCSGTAFRADAESGLIEIYSEIGDGGVSAAAFKQKLDALKGKDVTVRINSPGGSVFDGIAMYNDLRAHNAGVKTEIVGVAASAASLLAMAADEIAIERSAFIMVHRAWAMTIGNTDSHIETAGILNKIDHSLARAYSDRTGQAVGAVTGWMSAETWFTADEAKSVGFADRIIVHDAPSAKFDLSEIYANVPAALRLSQQHRVQPNVAQIDVERWLVAKGFPHRAARRMAEGQWPGSDQSIAAKLEANLAELRNIRGN